jgi:hypothetical protein
MNKFSRKAFQTLAVRSLVVTQKMSYMTVQTQKPFRAVVQTGFRSFAALPEHTKLEMPNLSPTMEKVRSTLYFRGTSRPGTKK